MNFINEAKDSETSSEEYYEFFKSESIDQNLLYIREILRFSEQEESETRKLISTNVEQALKKIASESKLNKIRIESIYNLKFENPDSEN
ncbi:MAG: hypothetical protein QM487_06845 [Candidatus Marithrix sp.]